VLPSLRGDIASFLQPAEEIPPDRRSDDPNRGSERRSGAFLAMLVRGA
jgi:hypothetical protein